MLPLDLFKIDASMECCTTSSYTFACVASKKYKITVAHSSLTSKSRIKQIFVGWYKEEPLVCPYDTISMLLLHTNAWRTTTPQQKALFLITRLLYNLVAVDTISHWIKSIIQISSPTSKAKNMCVLSTFFAQNASSGLETILALGNWFSNTTYQCFINVRSR